MENVRLSELDENAFMRLWGEVDVTVRPAMLIFAGGAYKFLSPRESEVTADFYTKNGYRCFIVDYSIGEYARYPEPLKEASRAIWEVRRNAELYRIDPDKIVLTGYSAGAHLVTMIAALWNHDISREGTSVPEGGNKISATVTGYTPTTFEDFFENLEKMRGWFTDEQFEYQKKHGGPYALMNDSCPFFQTVESLTSTRFINEKTPPAFLWQTTGDNPGFAWDWAAGLKKYGIPYELHYFTDDNRTLGMCTDIEEAEQKGYAKNCLYWPQMSLNWLEKILG